MFEVKLTQENGTCYSSKFDDYDAMVAWIAGEPDAGIMAWEDSEDIGTSRLIQLQQDVEAHAQANPPAPTATMTSLYGGVWPGSLLGPGR